jgi:hypothetical protein
MPETQTQTEEAPQGLILVGHFHHEALCECKTATRVESYYKKLPGIICPGCKKNPELVTSFHEEPFISAKTITCVGCGCQFICAPMPEDLLCPTCVHPPDAVDGPGA